MVKNLLGGKGMCDKKKIRSVTAALAALLMASMLLASCKADAPAVAPNEPEATPAAATGEESGNARYTEDGRRIITIGTWYNKYYVSKHTDIYDDGSVPQPDGTEETDRQIMIARTRLAKMRELEQKYNIVLEYVNLTYEGIQESISVSIPEGAPDVDVYETELQFGVPAVLNGYAVSLEELELAGTDVFTKQVAMKNLSLMGQSGTYLFNASIEGGTSAYVLAFNMNLIRAAGLENPQDLYDRGEWTWDVWRDYLKALTKDTDGDGKTDVYG
ncbi:MAG: extracellular solute-binding protein, partial [Oscillospiraceae bacterium]|nr:extracellular solute-binding protein [Oscillospiraceae bacterium]